MFWKETKKTPVDSIHEGALFKRELSNNLVETARVLSIRKDTFGIPHVKYEVRFERSQEKGRAFEGPRVLALSVFADNYRHCGESV
ncbi:MAG: hypothetical protein OEO83_18460 [Alphaproteobacteria bacterium]|nr:hypothetical protein [Alphaproteobacteria bacterium]